MALLSIVAVLAVFAVTSVMAQTSGYIRVRLVLIKMTSFNFILHCSLLKHMFL
jgi:hypothetical protein